MAEILLGDVEERKKVLGGSRGGEEENSTMKTDHTYETIAEREQTAMEEEGGSCHNDSSVSSASQLLEDPSPMSWAFASPTNDLDGEFTLKRQRGIRRKRHRKDTDKPLDGKRAKRRSTSRSPSAKTKTEAQPTLLAEAVNRNVKKLALETDLDTTLGDEKFEPKALFCGLEGRGREEGRKTNIWDLDSPKSTLTDDFHSSKSYLNSVTNTPETPLVATVRRCLKFSPETAEPPRPNCHGSIEIEYSVVADQIHVRGEIWIIIQSFLFIFKRNKCKALWRIRLFNTVRFKIILLLSIGSPNSFQCRGSDASQNRGHFLCNILI